MYVFAEHRALIRLVAAATIRERRLFACSGGATIRERRLFESGVYSVIERRLRGTRYSTQLNNGYASHVVYILIPTES